MRRMPAKPRTPPIIPSVPLSIPGAQKPPFSLTIEMIIFSKTKKRKDKGKTDKLATKPVIHELKPILTPGIAPRPISKGPKIILRMMLIYTLARPKRNWMSFIRMIMLMMKTSRTAPATAAAAAPPLSKGTSAAPTMVAITAERTKTVA